MSLFSWCLWKSLLYLSRIVLAGRSRRLFLKWNKRLPGYMLRVLCEAVGKKQPSPIAITGKSALRRPLPDHFTKFQWYNIYRVFSIYDIIWATYYTLWFLNWIHKQQFGLFISQIFQGMNGIEAPNSQWKSMGIEMPNSHFCFWKSSFECLKLDIHLISFLDALIEWIIFFLKANWVLFWPLRLV